MPIQIPSSFRTGRAALLGASTCLVLASPAFAQDGMRYLSWSGKPALGATQPQAQVQSPPPQARAQPVSNGRYPSIASASGRPSRYSPSVASGALTPANAWMAAAPSMAPSPMPQPPMAPPSAYIAPPTQPQAYAQPTYAPLGYAPQQVAVPQTGMSAQPMYAQPNYTPQPMPGPHYQQQQQQLQHTQAAPGPAWAQPGYSPQVYGLPTPQQVQPHAQTQTQAQPQFQAQAPAPTQAPAQFQPPQQPTPVQQQAYSPTVTGPGWASPQPVSAGSPVADPMAPRRDAPIFSIQSAQRNAPSQVMMQQPQGAQNQAQNQAQAQGQTAGQNSGQNSGLLQALAQPQVQQTASADGPSRGGARYYSVHRAAGHEPDPTAMPESVYAVIPEGAFLDAARTDLADPPPPPIQTRTINGRVQAINQGADPSLP